MNWAHFWRDIIQILIAFGIAFLILTVGAAIFRVIWSDFQKKDGD